MSVAARIQTKAPVGHACDCMASTFQELLHYASAGLYMACHQYILMLVCQTVVHPCRAQPGLSEFGFKMALALDQNIVQTRLASVNVKTVLWTMQS